MTLCLAMNPSLAATMQGFVAAGLHSAGLEAAGPALMAIAVLWLARPRFAHYAVGAGTASMFLAWVTTRLLPYPEAVMAAAAVPACGLTAFMARCDPPIRRTMPSMAVAAALLAGLLSWTLTPPRTFKETYVLMPEAPDVFEAQFFRHYTEALDFAGVKAKQVMRPEDVPPGSLLLLPWTTSPFTDEQGDPVTQRIGKLSRERRWTIVVGGEHNDMGGVATRIEAMSGRPILRGDLTVPPGNADTSGPLHVSDFRAWPHEAILNRGASVRLGSVIDRVLLSGDGWWAEPDMGEWLWVGDYVWHPGERAGRLILASSSDSDGARWIILGDNSPLINKQLYADPRPMIRLLELATLWPAFLKDIVLTALSIFLYLLFAAPKRLSLLPFMAVGSVAALALAAVAIPAASLPSIGWRDAYVGESGFDERNFNSVLAENPALVDGRRLIRMEVPVSGSVPLPEGDSLIFMLVDGTAEIGGVKLSGCRRLGSLSTTEGPYLMDAQACRVDGSGRVLIGTREGAAAIAVTSGLGKALVILDAVFLAQKAPDTNTKWLLKEIER